MAPTLPTLNAPDTRRRVSFPQTQQTRGACWVLAMRTARNIARPHFDHVPRRELIRYVRTTSRRGTFAASYFRSHKLHGRCVVCGSSKEN